MKSGICKARLSIVLAALAILVVTSSACILTPKPASNQPPIISSLEAQYINVYPLANSEIQCVASDPDGNQISFNWSCTGGSLSGVGSSVTWEAPNSYGDYHVMAIVKDSEGGSDQATLTLSVVSRPQGTKDCCK